MRWAVAGLVALATLGAGSCTNAGAHLTAAGNATTVTIAGGAADPHCGATVPAPRLVEHFRNLIADVTEFADLPPAPRYRRFEIACDDLGATWAAVPASWSDQQPVPGAPPRSLVTRGPDLSAPIDAAPVVTIGSARFLGPRPDLDYLNGNNAMSQSEGPRDGSQRGQPISTACAPLDTDSSIEGPADPTPFTIGGSSGEIQVYLDCGGSDRIWLLAAAKPDDGRRRYTFVSGQAFDTADLDAILRTLSSLHADADHLPGIELPPLPPGGP